MTRTIEQLRVRKLREGASIPKRATPDAAGYDLTSIETLDIQPGGMAIVSTGLSIAVPPGTYGRIAPRSGLAAKYGVGVGAGVVDAGYRGEVKVILFNHGSRPVHIDDGDRIAQLVVEQIQCPEVRVCDELDDTERGEGGFGSTGMR